MSRILDILKENMGKFIGITYVDVISHEANTLYGKLVEVNDECVVIEGLARHHLNSKIIVIMDVITH